MIKLEQTTIKILCNPLPPNNAGHLLRGVFGNIYRNRPEFHHHSEDGFIYKHPLIQYKIIESTAHIVGIREGSDLLRLINIPSSMRLGSNRYHIVDVFMKTKQVNIGLIDEMMEYTFLSPWLPLNSQNYERYKRAYSKAKQTQLLSDILIGNLLSLSKGLGYRVPDEIKVEVHVEQIGSMKVKNTNLLGFLGVFWTNFALPNLWGIGKSSSFGYGTVRSND